MSATEESDEGFKVGDRVEVFEVPGGYLVARPGTFDEPTARRLAEAAQPAIDALREQQQ